MKQWLASNMIQVYVRLLNEGVDVCRPTTGTLLRPMVVQLNATIDYDPFSEEWEFGPGSIVECKFERCHGGTILIAKRAAKSTQSWPTTDRLVLLSG